MIPPSQFKLWSLRPFALHHARTLHPNTLAHAKLEAAVVDALGNTILSLLLRFPTTLSITSTLLCTSYFLSRPIDPGVLRNIPVSSPAPLFGVINEAAAEERRADFLASLINAPDFETSTEISRKKRLSISGVTGSLVVRCRR